MDPKRLGNAMLGLNDYTTADVLNQPIRRGAILPWTEYADRSEFDPTSGLPGAFYNALMAPSRAYRGEISEDQQIPEAFNFAGSLTLGNLLSGAAAPVKARAISAYKAMGPEDAPANSLTTTRISGANRFMFDDPANGVYDNAATAFANQRHSAPTGEEILGALYRRGMGPANSNSATAELFANAKTAAAVPLATKALEAQQPQGIKAFHGSPHDFDRFSMDAIGSGEGAQAYGHGLYFAENEGVAKAYREALSDKTDALTPVTFEGRKIGPSAPGISGEDLAARFAAQSGGNAKLARAHIRGMYNDPKNLPPAHKEAMRLLTEQPERFASAKYLEPGHMYEVNIKANQEDFLDWDKPLSQQSEKVRGALGSLAKKSAYLSDEPEYASYWLERLTNAGAHTAGDMFKSSASRFNDRSIASSILREAGIPGIRYLDQMSRGSGEGSSNYVVFDDKLIEIMRKYGLLGPVAAGTVAAATNDEGPIY